MIRLMNEVASKKLRFEKDQADHYSIYDGDSEIGYAYCDGYYSGNRVWTVVIEIGSAKESNTASSVADAKRVAKSLYDAVLEKKARWDAWMTDEE